MSNDSNTTQRDELAAILMDAFERASTSRGGRHWENVADAILFDYLLVPRIDLPAVSHSPRNGLCTALAQENFQPQLVRGRDEVGPAFNREIALANLAIAEALDRRTASEAETKLQERRDALTHALIMDGKVKHGEPWTYADTTPLVRRAVDRIIKLEDATEATK